MAELDLDQSGHPAPNVDETEAKTIRWLHTPMMHGPF